MYHRMSTRLLLCLALVLTAALYSPGLSGPFVFDDFWNLAPVEKWLTGTQSWKPALLPNTHSIIASRPVSMASFMLTLWLGGLGTFSFKLGNLVVHLACGLLGWWILRRSLQQDPRLSAHAAFLAAAATVIWLLHPLHVSTVLYAVQRMTQLSAFFTLASLAVYLIARAQLAEGRVRLATVNLFASVPLLIALGVLSKQNAAVAPYLCLVLELAYFSRTARRSKHVTAFFTLFAFLPAIVAGLGIAWQPSLILEGYRDWGFTLQERLLTQPRILLDYLGSLLVPYSPAMGLYTDDFPISTGLLKPITTLLSIAALAVLSVLAWFARRRAPSVFAGWFFFLVAHAVESSFLPLEMYYEHRNYLPSFGLLLGLVGLCAFIPVGFRTPRFSLQRIAFLGFSVLALALSIATLGRVLVWQNTESIVEQGYANHPNSMRATLSKISIAIDNKDYVGARNVIHTLLGSEQRRHRVVGRLHTFAIDCMQGNPINDDLLDMAAAEALPEITVYEAQMIRLMENASQLDGCRGRAESKVADTFKALLDAATSQPETSPNKFVMREIIARLYARAGRWADAKHQAEIAWRAGGIAPTGALLVRIYVKNGEYAKAKDLLRKLERQIDPGDKGGQQELERLRPLVLHPSQPLASLNGRIEKLQWYVCCV